MSNTCYAEIKRFEYMQELYKIYSKLCFDYFGWKSPPKNSFARWVTESLLYDNIDPILPSTTQVIIPNPIVKEICEDFPGKVYPLLPFINNLTDMNKHINIYLSKLDLFLSKIVKILGKKLNLNLYDKANDLYEKIKNLRSNNFVSLKSSFSVLSKECNETLVELCEKLAIEVSDKLLAHSVKFAEEIKNLGKVSKKVLKQITKECNVELVCDNLRTEVSSEVYCRLSTMGKNFEIWKMLQRYETLTSIDPKSASLQAAIPYRLMEYLKDQFGVNFECFASPVNCYFKNFCSAFKDTDEIFGSKGNFLDYHPKSGSFEANPPFSENLMLKMVEHMHELLKSKSAISFVIILPNWEDSEANIEIKNSKYLKGEILAKRGEHFYRDITQVKHFAAVHDTRISILQNASASKKWPVTKDNLQGLLDNFAE